MRSNNIGKLVHIKKLCNEQSHLQMLAIKQRPPIFNLIKDHSSNGNPHRQDPKITIPGSKANVIQIISLCFRLGYNSLKSSFMPK